MNDIGEEQFAYDVLGIEPETLENIKVWNSLSKVEKIEKLIGTPESIRDFHNLCYAHYRDHKKAKHAAWKKKDWKYHLGIIKKIVNRNFDEIPLTSKDLKEITMRCYFVFYKLFA